MKVKIFVFFLTTICAFVEPAKILGIFPTPANSHFTLGFRLMKELADRGHAVTVVNPFPQKVSINNYTDIPVENMKDVLEDLKKEFYDREKMSIIASIQFLHNMAYKLTEKLLSHENFQKLLRSEEKFDIIVMEYFMSDATMGIGKLFNAPVVLFSSLPSSSLISPLFANPTPPSYIPHLLSQYSSNMNFWQRFTNLFYYTYDKFYTYFHTLPLHNQLLKTYISPKIDIDQVRYNASLILLNSHPSVTQSVPHTTNMIEIGGFHISSTKPLPDDLKSFMDEAKEGVVLFSMGSILKSSNLDKMKRKAILNSFSKIKQRVLWKFEDELSELPENVKVVKWLPQQDLLAHPNTKAFISHGGLLSSIEAVYFGVPIIGIPVYGDQKTNIATAVERGYAVSIPFQELTEESLSWSLNEVLNNPKYAEIAKDRSTLMHDQIVKPLDSAMYWIEFVIRHKGATHLQSAGIHLNWFKRNLIDIIIVLVIIDVILFLIFYYIFKHIIHHVRNRLNNNKSYKKL